MKSIKQKNSILVFQLLFLLISIFNVEILLGQDDEDDAVIKRYDWYYGQRMYPFDSGSIPTSGFGDAIADRNTLRGTTGFQLSSPSNWVSKGPTPFAYGGHSPCSGKVNNIKYDPRDATGNTIYITGAEGGIWKTSNGGTNWYDKSGDLPTLSSGAIAIDSTNNILYYGSGDYSIYYGSDKGLGMFKSTNDGVNWISISSGLPTRTVIYRIVISPSDPNLIFIAEFTGLYKTTNGGNNWSKIIPTHGGDFAVCSDVCFSPNGSKVYAVGSAPDYWVAPFNGIGYWRSTDGGSSFSQIGQSSGFPQSSTSHHGRSCLSVSRSTENLVWIMSYDNTGNSRLYVYKSTNAGLNFSNHTEGAAWDMGGNAGANEVIRCSDSNPDICFMGFQDSYRTTDGGTSWSPKGGYYGGHGDVHAIDFNPSNANKIAEGNDGGIFLSTNLGDNWSSVNQTLNITMIYRVASNTYDPNSIVGGFQDFGFGYKNVNSTEWTSANFACCDGTGMLASPFKSNYFVGSSNAFTYMEHSTNGTSFSEASDYIGYPNAFHSVVAPVVNHPTQPGTLYTVRYGPLEWPIFTPIYLLKSTNYGASWSGSSPLRTISPNPYDLVAPSLIAISPSNPNIIVIDEGNGSEFWHYNYQAVSRLLKSTNGGLNWLAEPTGSITPIVIGGTTANIPDRFFTHVEFDPNNENEFYLTVSGYGSGHVFKTTNGGNNWTDISENLPDNPVNDLIIHYPDCSSKELIIATDVGVFVSDASTISWTELAAGLPNTSISDLDYNRLSGKLFASAFGRGIWESQIDDIIYIKDKVYVTDNATLNLPIVVCNKGKLVLGLTGVTSPMTINFENGADITVNEGGTVLANSSAEITLSSSGTWDGIAVNGQESNCILYHCTFENTTTPIVINVGAGTGIPSPPEYGITINDCHFTNAPIQVTGRSDVNIEHCDWTMNSNEYPNAIIASGAENIYCLYSDINYTTQVLNSYGIFLSDCNNGAISRSTITNCEYPITVTDASYSIRFSHITTSYESNSYHGITFYGADGWLLENYINGYQVGFFLDNYSTPISYLDSAVGSNSQGYAAGIECDNHSNPRIRPSRNGSGEIVWDGGKGVFRNDYGHGIGLYVHNTSNANLDSGYNRIFGETNILADDYSSSKWFVRCNSWENNPPVFNVPLTVTMNYTPTDCTPPGDAPRPGKGGDDKSDNQIELVVPPEPLIVNYGNGVIDTLSVTTGSANISPDQALYGDGEKQLYLRNFEDAISKFESVINNYSDSAVAVLALNKLLYCNTRSGADSNAYNGLRTYFINVASGNTDDTSFYKTAMEMSRKCLIRKKAYAQAINEYEDVVQNSQDSSDIISAEINIVEIYSMMGNGGDSRFSYTGRLAYLKPTNLIDAMHKIRALMGHKRDIQKTVIIPGVFSLSQNYPNPFNPLTTIKYSIPRDVKVAIKIYDILGRQVKTLVNDFKKAGYYEVKFDGTNFASGVYFYKLEAGEFVQSKKMVIVK